MFVLSDEAKIVCKESPGINYLDSMISICLIDLGVVAINGTSRAQIFKIRVALNILDEEGHFQNPDVKPGTWTL